MKMWKNLTIAVIFISLITGCIQQGEEENTIIGVTENIQGASKPAQQIIMEEYIKNYDGYGKLFLYDITGDNFPELMELDFPDDIWNCEVYDFSGNEPVSIGRFNGEEGEIVYLCQDEEENRFILSHFGIYKLGACSYYCEKDLIDEHVMKNMTLGTTVTYFINRKENKYYNGSIYFAGEEREGVGFWEQDSEGKLESEKRLINHMNEYIGKCEILDTITLPEYDEEDLFLQEMSIKAKDYHYIPDYDYEEWLVVYQKEMEEQSVTICGKEYDSQMDNLCLDWEDLDETFDSDVLNEFSNLKSVYFEEGFKDETYPKITIKVSEWCQRVQKMSIAPKCFELSGDLDQFSSLRELSLWGDRKEMGDVSFITDFPKLKVVNLWIDNVTMDLAEQISRMETVEVVTWSGQRFFYGEMTEKERMQIETMFSDKVFIAVK